MSSTTLRSRVTTSRIMASVGNRDSVAECALRRRLWANGLRYRLRSSLYGRPDIVFPQQRVVVFVDGDLWHGNSWRLRGLPDLASQFPTNTAWWVAKITRNIERDAEVTRNLQEQGWTVLRFWESDLLRCPNAAARQIAAAIGRMPDDGAFLDLPLSEVEKRRLSSVVPKRKR